MGRIGLPKETLNREKMIKDLTFKALNKFQNQGSAGVALGRSDRSVRRYMKKWGIKKDVDGSFYFSGTGWLFHANERLVSRPWLDLKRKVWSWATNGVGRQI